MKKHNPGFLAIVTDAKARVKEITVAEVVARRAAGESFGLIDVREQSEWAEGHAQGAVHLGKGVIERDIESVFSSPDTPLVLYCGGGFRSALAADNIQKMGYTNVLSLAGGWSAWNEAGAPVESNAN